MVFVPLLFWPGLMGQFMKWMPITFMVALSSSLFVALVVNPALSTQLLTVVVAPSVTPKNWFANGATYSTLT